MPTNFGRQARAVLRPLVGYRNEDEMQEYWWHRLWQVATVITGCLVLLLALGSEWRRFNPPPLPRIVRYNLAPTPRPARPVRVVEPVLITALITGGYLIIVANLYYRGIVYIVKGPRQY